MTFYLDLQHGFRQIQHKPFLTAITILTLALGIGANTALFHAFLNALEPRLPYPQPDRIATIWLRSLTAPNAVGYSQFSYPDLLDWRARTHSFSGIAASTYLVEINFGGTHAERIHGVEVTANIFDVFRVHPFMGRIFWLDDETGGSAHVVILSYAFWRGHLGGDPALLRKTIKLNGVPYSVIGIMPADFRLAGLPECDLLLPLKIHNASALDRSNHFLVGYGRLRAGVDMEAADRELAAIERNLAREHPAEDGAWTAGVLPARSLGAEDSKRKLPFFASATVLLLLLGCANSASLALIGYMHRHSEMIVRTALGATRSRIAKQVFTECSLIASISGALGFGIALGAIQLIRTYEAIPSAGLLPAIPDGRVVGVCSLLVLGTAFLFAIVPAVSTSRLANITANAGVSPRITSTGRTRRSLVVVGLALGISLLTVTGLLARTLRNLYSTDLGFKPDNLLEGELVLQSARYASTSARRDFFDGLLSHLRTDLRIPAAVTSYFPLSGMDGTGGGYFIPDTNRVSQQIETAPIAGVDVISNNFFSVLGVKLIAGRSFKDHETRPVVIINQELANRYWPHQNSIGRIVTFLGPMEPSMDSVGPMEPSMDSVPRGPREIVGVVSNVLEFGARQEKLPYLYIPFDQDPIPWVSVIVQTDKPSRTAALLKAAVTRIDPDIPLSHIRTGPDLVKENLKQVRFQTLTVSIFSAVAVLLSFIGIFSVISEDVRHRRKEFAVRMAVGADPGQIRKMLYANAFILLAYGSLPGVALSVAIGRSMSALLFGVKSWDLATFAMALSIMGLAVASACYPPSRQLSRPDMLSAIRSF